ncbi:hypothetical protein TWF730_002905 [Orbilia blumenaviensis]|uniref:F-box domain-containing protein n=1 Tax=Orbilia blumenaviensis TaxID=1796055 RepID=A0AAV9U7F5_9PEZI
MDYLPPEILIQILESCTGDVEKLPKLRLVNRTFNSIIISYFWYPKIRLCYGLPQAVPQMRALAGNVVLAARIKVLFIPSESFFPGDNWEEPFSSHYSFPWSRRRNFRSMATSHNSSKKSFCEDPENESISFSLDNKEHREEAEHYFECLCDLLTACKNLKILQIAMGFGWDSNRMTCWASILAQKLFPLIAKTGVEKLRLMIPLPYHMRLFLADYLFYPGEQVELSPVLFPKYDLPGPAVTFPLQSVAVMTDVRGNESYAKTQFAKTLRYFFQDDNVKLHAALDTSHRRDLGPSCHYELEPDHEAFIMFAHRFTILNWMQATKRGRIIPGFLVPRFCDIFES